MTRRDFLRRTLLAAASAIAPAAPAKAQLMVNQLNGFDAANRTLAPLSVTRVASQTTTSSTTTSTSTACPQLDGPGIVVATFGANSGISTCTYSNNGAALTWVPIASNTADKGLFTAYAIISGSRAAGLTVTATTDVNMSSGILIVDWITGVDTANLVDVSAVNHGASGASANTALASTTNPDDVILGSWRGNTPTWDGTYTSLGNVSNNCSTAYKVVSATGVYDATVTQTTTSWALSLVAFKRVFQ
jgi:hypothetical protein